MKKKTHKQFVKWIEKKIVEYRHLLNLNHWSVQTFNHPEKDKNEEILFIIDFAGYGYLKAYLRWTNLSFEKWQKGEIQTLERGLLHELIHIILHNFQCQATDRYVMKVDIEAAEETVCDHLSLTIHRILKDWRAK